VDCVNATTVLNLAPLEEVITSPGSFYYRENGKRYAFEQEDAYVLLMYRKNPYTRQPLRQDFIHWLETKCSDLAKDALTDRNLVMLKELARDPGTAMEISRCMWKWKPTMLDESDLLFLERLTRATWETRNLDWPRSVAGHIEERCARFLETDNTGKLFERYLILLAKTVGLTLSIQKLALKAVLKAQDQVGLKTLRDLLTWSEFVELMKNGSDEIVLSNDKRTYNFIRFLLLTMETNYIPGLMMALLERCPEGRTRKLLQNTAPPYLKNFR